MSNLTDPPRDGYGSPAPGADTYEGQLAERCAELLTGIGTEERLELLGVMDEGDMRASLAWLAAAHPVVFDHSLARDRQLVEVLQERLDDARDAEDDLEPYCTACGASVGIFWGHGDGYHHYRSSEGGTEIYDAGHVPAVSWAPAGER